MPAILDQLVAQLALERIEENLFRGQSQDLGWGAVFGGQVLGQALSAAVQTVAPERHVHSLHAYFLRSGDVKRPIVYINGFEQIMANPETAPLPEWPFVDWPITAGSVRDRSMAPRSGNARHRREHSRPRYLRRAP